MSWHDPLLFFALLVIPVIYYLRSRKRPSMRVIPFAAAWDGGSRFRTRQLELILFTIGLGLLIAAAARPQLVQDRRSVRQSGYDLVLAIDLSGSMLFEDYENGVSRMNRWEVVRPVVEAFIQQRVSDRIGVVVFSGKAYTLAPLTFDHDWLKKQIQRLQPGKLDPQTAIGDGLALALSRLELPERMKEQKRKGAFVVLLTDGANNRGMLTPEQATEQAKLREIPVYTIGVGEDGEVPAPVIDQNGNKRGYQMVRSDLDEASLQRISDQTKGAFFRAKDPGTIKGAFAAIDRAKKIDFEAKTYRLAKEYFPGWAQAGMGCCLVAWCLRGIGRKGRS